MLTENNLAPGTRLTVMIHDLAFGGEGVARYEEFVVFVPFVLVGETVEVELTEVKKRFGRAKLPPCGRDRWSRSRPTPARRR